MRSRPPTPYRHWLVNSTILVITVSLVLIIGELVVRFVFRDLTTTADNTSYFSNRWKKNNFQVNRLGFREREFSSVKPNNTYRIAIIGDSFAYGQGIIIDRSIFQCL